MSDWTEIKLGWGLQEIQRADGLECVECPGAGTGKLYTDQPLPTGNSIKELDRERAKIRNRIWCKRHAIWFFRDTVA